MNKRIDEKKLTKILFIMPAFVLVGIFMFYPALSGFHLSLTDWNGLSDKIDFVGLRNYKEMFNDRVFKMALKNTVIYTLFVVIIQHTISLTLAILIDKGVKGSQFYKAVLFIPCLLSTIVTGMVFSLIFSPINGSFNAILEAVGMSGLVHDWLGQKDTALFVVIATSIWQYIGYSMVIYLAGLQTIPGELLEASEIDGASAWQRFIYIEFPCIAPAFTINTVLSMIGSLKAFEIVYSMTGGGPANATQVVATYVYQVGFTSSRFGYGSAVSVFLFVLVVIVSVFQAKILRRREEDLG